MNVQTVKPPDAESDSTAGAEHQILPGLKCINCGYDLRGLSEYGNCPECGEPVYASLVYEQYRVRRTAVNDGAYNLLIIVIVQAVIPIGCLIAAKVAGLAHILDAHALAMGIDYGLQPLILPQIYPFLMLLALGISLRMANRRTHAYGHERQWAVLIACLTCWIICWGACLLESALH